MPEATVNEDGPSNLDHAMMNVDDIEKTKAFYTAAMEPLGYKLLMDVPEQVLGSAFAGFGAAGKPDLWFKQGEPKIVGLHLAFRAPNHAAVDAWYKAAIAAGGTDNGPPGLRTHYHASYYGAFVIDPNGHNIEAVCHTPAAPSE